VVNHRSNNCSYRTCQGDGDHYHYIVKFDQQYLRWIERNKKNMFYPPQIQQQVDLRLISHKMVKNLDHYNNFINYMNKYDDINWPEDRQQLNNSLMLVHMTMN
jgi:hypothetical protein